VRTVIFSNDVKWQVYPNPSTGLFSLVYQVTEAQKIEVKVFDANGKLVKTSTNAGSGFVQKMSIDLQAASFPAGLYLVEAVSGEKKQLFKLLKQ